MSSSSEDPADLVAREAAERFGEPGTLGGDAALLAALGQGEEANIHGRACQVCQGLEKMSEPARLGVERALAGTIGERSLAAILTSNGYPTGRRAVARHRLEGHS